MNLEIEITFKWVKFNPDGQSTCECCKETIYSKIYSIHSLVNGEKIKEFDPSYRLCESCFNIVDRGHEIIEQ